MKYSYKFKLNQKDMWKYYMDNSNFVPFYIFMVVALMLIAFVPEVSLFLPNLLK